MRWYAVFGVKELYSGAALGLVGRMGWGRCRGYRLTHPEWGRCAWLGGGDGKADVLLTRCILDK